MPTTVTALNELRAKRKALAEQADQIVQAAIEDERGLDDLIGLFS